MNPNYNKNTVIRTQIIIPTYRKPELGLLNVLYSFIGYTSMYQ